MPGTVRAEQPHVGEVALELVEEPCFVVGWHTFGDGHDERDATLGGLHHGILHTRCGDEDAACGCAGCFDGLGHRCVHRHTVDVGASLGWMGAGDYLGAVFSVQAAVVAALSSRSDPGR